MYGSKISVKIQTLVRIRPFRAKNGKQICGVLYMNLSVKRIAVMLLTIAILLSYVPVFGLAAEETEENGFKGRTVSILGDSISTYTGVSDNTSYNSTLGGGAIYYTAGRWGVYREDTWWQQAIDGLDMELLVNNSWSGSCILTERYGTVGAYIDRCVQLHDNSGREPDIIALYLGTNDFSVNQSKLGDAASVDRAKLIKETDDGSTYAEPQTVCEAYAIMLDKMTRRYPDAEIYCFTLLPRINQSADAIKLAESFNASVKLIASSFGAYSVDLYGDSGIKADKNFQYYIADNSLHPGPEGMDAITGCFTSALLKNSRYSSGEVYDVSYDLTGVIVSEGTARAVLGGKPFSCTLTAPADKVPEITVMMDGEDITESCLSESTVSIGSVTGDIHITADAVDAPFEPKSYRWECKDDALVSVTERENAANELTLIQGTITNGKFSNVKYKLDKTVTLKHDLPWIIEWRSSGSWSDTDNGGLLFASAATSSAPDAPYLYRRRNSDLIALGMYTGGKYQNYGVSLASHGIDGTAEHTFRLENRVFDDGSNMVYLFVDGEEIAPMTSHWSGGTDQHETGDWVNGRDFAFTNMGTSPHTIGNCYIDYIQVWENGHIHNYENGFCTGCGKTDPDIEFCDLDGNGAFDSDDAVYLLRYTLFPAKFPITKAADFDADGDVDSDDAVYLLRRSLFGEKYPIMIAKT